MTEEEKIRANAALVAKTLRDVCTSHEFGYDDLSVKWLEGFIERQRVRADLSDERKRQMGGTIACWLGECIIACHGGAWRNIDGRWGIEFSPGNAAFPFAKVEKQFRNGVGEGDSIYGLFKGLPALLKGEREIRQLKMP
jgi:hypothetical protein